MAKVPDNEFAKAREEFSKRWPTDELTPAFVSNELADSTRRRLRHEPSHRFGEDIKRKVVRLTRGFSSVAYEQLAALLGQQSEDHVRLTAVAKEKYVYFRYLEEGPSHQLRYVQGRLTFLSGQEQFLFEHTSGNYQGRGAEHTGYAFMVGENLFMLGSRPRVLRLAIAHVMKDVEQIEHLWGVVASVKRAPELPFAARFLMVPTSNATLIEKLSEPGGEEMFRSMSEQAGAIYYMLRGF